MELKYNIGFIIGDIGFDGHCQSKEYHMVSNYSVKEITEAYKELSKELDWEFLEECTNYQQKYLSKEGERHLVNLGILNESDLKASKIEYENDTYTLWDTNEFVEIFLKLVKIKLPDLMYKDRELDEQYLSILNGKGYGLFSL